MDSSKMDSSKMDSSKMDSSKMDIAEATANLNRLQEQLEKGGDKSKALTEVIVLTRDYIVKIDQSEAVRSHVVQLVQMFWHHLDSTTLELNMRSKVRLPTIFSTFLERIVTIGVEEHRAFFSLIMINIYSMARNVTDGSNLRFFSTDTNNQLLRQIFVENESVRFLVCRIILAINGELHKETTIDMVSSLRHLLVDIGNKCEFFVNPKEGRDGILAGIDCYIKAHKQFERVAVITIDDLKFDDEPVNEKVNSLCVKRDGFYFDFGGNTYTIEYSNIYSAMVNEKTVSFELIGPLTTTNDENLLMFISSISFLSDEIKIDSFKNYIGDKLKINEKSTEAVSDVDSLSQKMQNLKTPQNSEELENKMLVGDAVEPSDVITPKKRKDTDFKQSDSKKKRTSYDKPATKPEEDSEDESETVFQRVTRSKNKQSKNKTSTTKASTTLFDKTEPISVGKNTYSVLSQSEDEDEEESVGDDDKYFSHQFGTNLDRTVKHKLVSMLNPKTIKTTAFLQDKRNIKMFDKRKHFVKYIRGSKSFAAVLEKHQEYERRKPTKRIDHSSDEDNKNSLYFYLTAPKEVLADNVNFRERKNITSIFDLLLENKNMNIYVGLSTKSQLCLGEIPVELGLHGKYFDHNPTERLMKSMTDSYNLHNVPLDHRCVGVYFLTGLSHDEVKICEALLINYLKCFFKRQCLNIDTMDSISDVIPSRKFMMMFNECAIEKFNTNKILFKDGTRKVNEYTVNEYDEIYIMENGRKLCDSDAVLSEDVNECTRIYDKLAKLKPNDFAKGFIKQINSKFTLSTIFNITKFCGFTQQQSYALRKLLWKNVVFLQTARVLIPLINERLHNRLCIRKMRIFSPEALWKDIMIFCHNGTVGDMLAVSELSFVEIHCLLMTRFNLFFQKPEYISEMGKSGENELIIEATLQPHTIHKYSKDDYHTARGVIFGCYRCKNKPCISAIKFMKSKVTDTFSTDSREPIHAGEPVFLSDSNDCDDKVEYFKLNLMFHTCKIKNHATYKMMDYLERCCHNNIYELLDYVSEKFGLTDYYNSLSSSVFK